MKKLKGFPVYVLLIPLILVIGLIYGGIIQRFIPAVKAGDTNYTASAFNYYFYEEYLDFTDEYYDELEEIGLDTDTALDNQECEGYGTWEDYFKQAAIERICRVETLLCKAEEDGYIFTDDDMALYYDELEGIYAYCDDIDIEFDTYLESYYGTTVTEKIFLKQLERESLAAAYEAVLMEGMVPTDEEVADALENSGEDETENYNLANVSYIWFAAPTDRFTEEFGETQATDLEIKAQSLLDLWEEEGATTEVFQALADKYSESEESVYDGLDKNTLSEEADEWCFDSQRKTGDTAYFISEDGLWVLCYISSGESADSAHMRQSLTQNEFDTWYETAALSCTERFGMVFAM